MVWAGEWAIGEAGAWAGVEAAAAKELAGRVSDGKGDGEKERVATAAPADSIEAAAVWAGGVSRTWAGVGDWARDREAERRRERFFISLIRVC